MRSYLTLTSFLLRCGLGSAEKSRKRKSIFSKVSKPVMYVFLIICCLPLIGMIFLGGKEGYILFQQYGQEKVLLEVACVLMAVITFFFAIPTIISIFYMSSDIERLLPLPLSAPVIVAAKATVSMLYDYTMVVLFLVPFLAGYGYAAGAGVLYWIFAVLACILMPVLPTIYAGLLSMIVMRLFKGIRNKDVLGTLSFAIALIFGLGISAVSQLFGQSSTDPQKIVDMIQSNRPMVNMIGNLFPNYRFLVAALADSSPIYMMLFLVTTVAIVALFLVLARKIYFSGVVGMTEGSAKKVVLSTAETSRLSQEKNPVRTYFWIELKLLFRTPVYLFNCALICFLMPLFVLIPLIIGLVASGALALSSLFQAGSILDDVRSVIGQSSTVGIAMLAVAGFAGFIASFNLTAATAISRTGENFVFMKYIPMSYRDQLKAKVLSGISLSLLSTVIYVAIALLILTILGMNPLFFVIGIVINILLVLLVNYIQLWIDLAFPKLVWENETIAVKQNFHSGIAMFLCMILVALYIGIGLLLCLGVKLSPLVVVPVLTVILAVITWLVREMMYRYGEKKIAEIE